MCGQTLGSLQNDGPRGFADGRIVGPLRTAMPQSP